jgi:hypothetical protein
VREMSKGWRYESGRHALAARGIKSGIRVVGPLSIRWARNRGESIANDAFNLGGNKTWLEEEIRTKEDMIGSGSDADRKIVNDMIEESYDSMIDGIEEEIIQTFRDEMSTKFRGSVDEPWEEEHPYEFHAFIEGYKNKMRMLHEEYMR